MFKCCIYFYKKYIYKIHICCVYIRTYYIYFIYYLYINIKNTNNNKNLLGILVVVDRKQTTPYTNMR